MCILKVRLSFVSRLSLRLFKVWVIKITKFRPRKTAGLHYAIQSNNIKYKCLSRLLDRLILFKPDYKTLRIDFYRMFRASHWHGDGCNSWFPNDRVKWTWFRQSTFRSVKRKHLCVVSHRKYRANWMGSGKKSHKYLIYSKLAFWSIRFITYLRVRNLVRSSD